MCGIAGFWNNGDISTLNRMVASLHHRGPDASNTYISKDMASSNGVHLGHTRLSILDIAMGGQPFIDDITKIAIVYNGEIYNHLELRQKLILRGHKFISNHSDTETVLRAFIEWGPECFNMFNGMFALAIHDPTQHRIWLARDRFGEKPLFYTQNKNCFAFASEIKALHLWSAFDTTLNMDNVQRYFAWGYMPGTRTIFQHCHSLRPGSWLCADLHSGKITHKDYYSFILQPDMALTDKDEPNLIEELRSLLVQAVKRRLMSDVPVGLFLSGGIDSSALLAAACQIMRPEQISAFTIGFTEKSFDETPNAAAVANIFGVQHHVSYLSMDSMRAQAAEVLNRMSEPLGDASLIPTHALAAFTREHVTVALSGDGGDELFAGYDPFLALHPARAYTRFMPPFLHKKIEFLANKLKASDKNMSLEFKLKRVLRGINYPETMRLPVWMSPLDPSEIRDIFDNPLSAQELYEDAINLWDKYPHLNIIDQGMMFFTHFYLPNNILVKVDRATMMASLESRAVFLDNDVVDFCSRLPTRFKLRGTTRKYLLKKALQGWLPEKILRLPKKGFGIPLNRWLREIQQCPPPLPGMNASQASKLFDRHMQRKGDHRLFLWSWLAMQALK